jgi:hypothetical protein
MSARETTAKPLQARRAADLRSAATANAPRSGRKRLTAPKHSTFRRVAVFVPFHEGDPGGIDDP